LGFHLDAVSGPFWPTLIKAILEGWLIAVMVWLLPSARTAKMFVIILVTYIVGIGRFSHIIAGSVDSAFAVFSGHAPVRAYVIGFLVPTLLGNTVVERWPHGLIAVEFREYRSDRQFP